MSQNLHLWAGASVLSSVVATQACTSTVTGSSVDALDYTGNALFILDSAAGTGNSLTTNGTFGADTDWTKGTGWSIGSNVATFAGHTTTSDLSQNQTVTEDAVYTVVFTVSSWSAGTITAYLGGTAGTARGADGTYTELITCGAGEDPKLILRASSTFRGSIDNVAVYDAKLAVKVQDSADNSSFADVSGLTFSPVYGIASNQKLVVNVDKLRRYIRTLSTSTGTSESFTHSVSFLGFKAYS